MVVFKEAHRATLSLRTRHGIARRLESERQRMKIAYLVLAHQDSRVLQRTVVRLRSPHSRFFVHIDRKTSLTEFERIRSSDVLLSEERVPVYWGGFSIVKATLLLLRQAMNHPQTFDYFVLLSGSDYPLRSSRYVHAFLENHRGAEFISMVKIPNEGFGMPLAKVNRIWFEPEQPVCRFLTRSLAKVGLAQRDHRKYLGGLEPFGGSQWWALTRGACEYILNFIERNDKIVTFFRHAPTCDETFFHTILGNAPFRSHARRSLTYADWSDGPNHPAMIGEHHLARFEDRDWVWPEDIWGSGEALFARKFSNASLPLLDRIDAAAMGKDADSPWSPAAPSAQVFSASRLQPALPCSHPVGKL